MAQTPNPGIRVTLSALFALLALTAGARATIITVDDDGPADYQNLAVAIASALPGDTVLVEDGMYWAPVFYFPDQTFTVRSVNGPNNCIINGTVQFWSSGGGNPLMEGFTITGGQSEDGGGIRNYSSSPTINNCLISGNAALRDGGGMYSAGGKPTLNDSIFIGNSAGDDGGALACYDGSDIRLHNCTFVNNSAEDNGGGMFCRLSDPMLTNCTFNGNTARSNAGGMYNRGNWPQLINCIFFGNSAEDDGGALCNVDGSHPILLSCTIAGNTAKLTGGMYNDSAPAMLLNSILWANTDSTGTNEASQIGVYRASAELAHCCVQGWTGALPGVANSGADPLFASGPLGDYYLSQITAGQPADSPCVDAGSNPATYFEMDHLTTRTDNAADVGMIDIGYHYFVPEPPDFDGSGIIDFVDFNRLAAYWPQTQCSPCGWTDLTDDGRIAADDLFALAAKWLMTRANISPKVFQPTGIVINEVLSHSHTGQFDWIELTNISDEPIDIGGWYFSDRIGYLKKYEIAKGTIMGPHTFKVFYEDQHFGNPSDPGCRHPFALNAEGETLYLCPAQAGILLAYPEEQQLRASHTDVPLGRHFNSVGTMDFVALMGATPYGLNAPPVVGPIVITEIMYDPWSSIQSEEYIELRNISGAPVRLCRDDTGEPWKLTEGIEFTFPDITISPGQHLLIVKNQVAFMQRYPAVPPNRILGPYTGYLNDSKARIELSMPTSMPYYDCCLIRIDSVSYDSQAPWPTDTTGSGQSLTKPNPYLYGNDPANWQARPPTPGS